MTWRPAALAVAYDDELLGWRLGDGHPTNPIRAKLCVEKLHELQVPMVVEPITWQLTGELEQVHTSSYVQETLVEGRNAEWQGARPDLSRVAAHMFAATVQLAHGIDRGHVRVGFSPQGAKHHAMRDHGSGFCVFNDMAWAARHFTEQGKQVLYVDLDAHHGDGVEALTREDPQVMTCSVHDRTIFPGTGHEDDEPRCAFNYPLAARAGDVELAAAVADVCRRGDLWQPDVVLIAIGGDGHETDPLSTLQYSYDGYRASAEALAGLAARHGAPVLMGGAGGYQPETHTPGVWAAFVSTFWRSYGINAP